VVVPRTGGVKRKHADEAEDEDIFADVFANSDPAAFAALDSLLVNSIVKRPTAAVFDDSRPAQRSSKENVLMVSKISQAKPEKGSSPVLSPGFPSPPLSPTSPEPNEGEQSSSTTTKLSFDQKH
jgi:hypothetical protein